MREESHISKNKETEKMIRQKSKNSYEQAEGEGGKGYRFVRFNRSGGGNTDKGS